MRNRRLTADGEWDQIVAVMTRIEDGRDDRSIGRWTGMTEESSSLLQDGNYDESPRHLSSSFISCSGKTSWESSDGSEFNLLVRAYKWIFPSYLRCHSWEFYRVRIFSSILARYVTLALDWIPLKILCNLSQLKRCQTLIFYNPNKCSKSWKIRWKSLRLSLSQNF